MNSKRMLLRLLRLGLLSLLFGHQTRPALSIKESVKELIVERPGIYDSFTVYMKPNRTCGELATDRIAFCRTLAAYPDPSSSTSDRDSCKCQCREYQPFTFLSSEQSCATNTKQVGDFGGEFSKHHTVEPWYNETLYNEVLGKTSNDFLCPIASLLTLRCIEVLL